MGLIGGTKNIWTQTKKPDPLSDLKCKNTWMGYIGGTKHIEPEPKNSTHYSIQNVKIHEWVL